MGCFFHYTRALRKKAQEIGLLSETDKIGIKDLLKELYAAPFYYYKDKNKINSILENLQKKTKKYLNLLNILNPNGLNFLKMEC